jgi:hypothetical protein
MKFFFSLAVLAHLRDNLHLTQSDIQRLSRGTYLRKEAQDQVLQALFDLGVISSWQSSRGARLQKNLFPEVLKVGK